MEYSGILVLGGTKAFLGLKLVTWPFFGVRSFLVAFFGVRSFLVAFYGLKDFGRKNCFRVNKKPSSQFYAKILCQLHLETQSIFSMQIKRTALF